MLYIDDIDKINPYEEYFEFTFEEELVELLFIPYPCHCFVYKNKTYYLNEEYPVKLHDLLFVKIEKNRIFVYNPYSEE